MVLDHMMRISTSRFGYFSICCGYLEAPPRRQEVSWLWSEVAPLAVALVLAVSISLRCNR